MSTSNTELKRPEEPEIAEEQIIYAIWLERGMLLGLALLFLTFALYVFEILQPVIPLGEISQYWGLSSKEYLQAVNSNFLHWDHTPTGWSWLKLLGQGDFLNFLPVAILAGITILCYIAVIPVFLKKKDTAYTVIAVFEVIILVLAASGLLAVGH
jgi:hypothetical protein